LLKSKNQPVDDIIELDDEEMEVDEDSIQVNSLGRLSKNFKELHNCHKKSVWLRGSLFALHLMTDPQ